MLPTEVMQIQRLEYQNDVVSATKVRKWLGGTILKRRGTIPDGTYRL